MQRLLPPVEQVASNPACFCQPWMQSFAKTTWVLAVWSVTELLAEAGVWASSNKPGTRSITKRFCAIRPEVFFWGRFWGSRQGTRHWPKRVVSVPSKLPAKLRTATAITWRMPTSPVVSFCGSRHQWIGLRANPEDTTHSTPTYREFLEIFPSNAGGTFCRISSSERGRLCGSSVDWKMAWHRQKVTRSWRYLGYIQTSNDAILR